MTASTRVAHRGEPVGEHGAGPVGLGEQDAGRLRGGTSASSPSAWASGRHEVDRRGRPPRPARPPSPARRRPGARAGWSAAAGPARRAPLADVTTSQSNAASRASAWRSAAPPSSGSAISISGTCTTVAPSAASRAPSSPASGRVTATRAARRRVTTRRPRGPPAPRRARRLVVASGRTPAARCRGRPRRRARRRGTCAAAPPATWAPTGNEQPEPSSARKLRSTSTAWRVAASSTAASSSIVAASPARASTATQPWPTAGTNTPGSSRSAITLGQPEHLQRGDGHHDRPAVGHLRQAGGDVAAQLDERQVRAHGGELGAPAHRARRDGRAVGEVVEATARSARRRRRDGRRNAPITSASWATDGRSLAECTATSARPSSTACWTSLTNTPCPPMTCSGTSWRRSPVVSTNTSSAAQPVAAASASATPWACVRACGLPRVASRMRRHRGSVSAGRRGRSRPPRCARPSACRRRGGGAPTGRAAAS